MLALRRIKNVCCTGHFQFQYRNHSIFHRGVTFFLKKHLFLTNTITSGGLMAIGDLAQQEFELHSETKLKKIDWARAGRMFLVGSLLGSVHHYYYVYLDKVLPVANLKNVTLKIFYDQVFVSPATIVCFFYCMGFLEKKTFEKCNEEIKLKFLYVYLGDCIFWPPVQFINFYFLPTHFRLIYINVATMIFNVFMSHMKHYDQH